MSRGCVIQLSHFSLCDVVCSPPPPRAMLELIGAARCHTKVLNWCKLMLFSHSFQDFWDTLRFFRPSKWRFLLFSLMETEECNHQRSSRTFSPSILSSRSVAVLPNGSRHLQVSRRWRPNDVCQQLGKTCETKRGVPSGFYHMVSRYFEMFWWRNYWNIGTLTFQRPSSVLCRIVVSTFGVPFPLDPFQIHCVL